MINSSNDLFGFNSPTLPGIFRNVNRKRTDKNTPNLLFSKHNTARQQVTLMSPLIKALWLYLGKDSQPHALGKLSCGFYAAELAAHTMPGVTHLAIYDPATGMVRASSRNANDGSNMKFNFNKGYAKTHASEEGIYHSDGTVIWLAMMDVICQDSECILAKKEILELFEDATLTEDELVNKLIPPVALFCDNVYRRATKLVDGQLLIENIGAKGPIKGFQLANLARPEYSVREVIIDGFEYFNSKMSCKAVKKIQENEFHLQRELNEIQKQHVFPLPSGHVDTEELRMILQSIKNGYEDSVYKLYNILIMGPPGSGKSQIAKAIAHYLGLPYYTIICSDGMTEDDFRGYIYPKIDETSSENDDRTAKMPFKTTNMAATFPSALEIKFEPENAYFKITGEKKKGVSSDTVMSRAYESAIDLLENENFRASSDGLEYVYVPSEVVLAFKYGGVLEIQEPGAIMSQTVLTFLNDIMNSDDGILYTPYEKIKRHKDCIVIGTNNPETDDGYKCLNPAVKDRFQQVYWVDLPPAQVMVDRVVERGIALPEQQLLDMADAIRVLDDTAKDKRIKGVAGMRSYIEWCKAVGSGQDFDRFLDICVINKMTNNMKEIEYLKSALQNNCSLSAYSSTAGYDL